MTMTEQNIHTNETEAKPNGLGGWLILIGIGIILAPIKISYFVYSTYGEIFSDGVWELLTTVGTEYYQQYFGTLLIIEISINILLSFAILYTAYLFFSKKITFPKWYIGILIFTILFMIIDALAVSVIFPDTEAFDESTTLELARSVVAAIIWIPYMLISVRVRNTFIN